MSKACQYCGDPVETGGHTLTSIEMAFGPIEIVGCPEHPIAGWSFAFSDEALPSRSFPIHGRSATNLLHRK
jgi:hypothetical protein